MPETFSPEQLGLPQWMQRQPWIWEPLRGVWEWGDTAEGRLVCKPKRYLTVPFVVRDAAAMPGRGDGVYPVEVAAQEATRMWAGGGLKVARQGRGLEAWVDTAGRGIDVDVVLEVLRRFAEGGGYSGEDKQQIALEIPMSLPVFIPTPGVDG